MSIAPAPSQNQGVPRPAPRIAAGPWADALQRHPRLLGPPGFVQELAREKPELYQQIRSSDLLWARGITQAVEGNHDVNWLTRTIAHSCILVYQPDEQWSQMRDGKIGARVGQAEVTFGGAVGGTLTLAGREFPLRPEVKKDRYE